MDDVKKELAQWVVRTVMEQLDKPIRRKISTNVSGDVRVYYNADFRTEEELLARITVDKWNIIVRVGHNATEHDYVGRVNLPLETIDPEKVVVAVTAYLTTLFKARDKLAVALEAI